jgi:hypothetical protein
MIQFTELVRRHSGHAGYLTFLRLGLAFLAAGEALRVELARMAPADLEEIPSELAILACTDLNPG